VCAASARHFTALSRCLAARSAPLSAQQVCFRSPVASSRLSGACITARPPESPPRRAAGPPPGAVGARNSTACLVPYVRRRVAGKGFSELLREAQPVAVAARSAEMRRVGSSLFHS
jgi:hypothetical protein